MMQRLLLTLACSIFLIACKKDKANTRKDVEFYLLESYQLVTGKCQVDPSTTRLQNSALVSNDDILWYDESDHEYRLKTSAVERINALQGRTPFAVTVDNQIIYLGIYMPPYELHLRSFHYYVCKYRGQNRLYDAGLSWLDTNPRHKHYKRSAK